jgi:hypothetical protein
LKIKFIFSGLISLVAGVSFAANVPDFGDKFPKFQINSNVEVTWAATNHLRDHLWTYKIVPQSFSEKGISELLRQGSFTNKVTAVSESILFVNSSNTCNLRIVPAIGYIKFWNEYAPAAHWDKTNHLWEKVEGVPSDSQIEKLGVKFLSKYFGIQRSDLAQKQDGHLITFGEKKTRSYFDRRTQKDIDSEVTSRGIFFIRRIDGVNFSGIGLNAGCEIEFGNHAKISEFILNWPNLEPFEQYDVADKSQLIQFIQDGKAVMTHKNLVNPAEIKSLTITDVAPFYSGTSVNEPQSFAYPFAQINATANLGYTNEDIQLYCPILDKQIITTTSTNQIGH